MPYVSECPKGCAPPANVYQDYMCMASSGPDISTATRIGQNGNNTVYPMGDTHFYMCSQNHNTGDYSCTSTSSIPSYTAGIPVIEDVNDPTANGDCSVPVVEPEPEEPVIDPVYQPPVGATYAGCPKGCEYPAVRIGALLPSTGSANVDYQCAASGGYTSAYTNGPNGETLETGTYYVSDSYDGNETYTWDCKAKIVGYDTVSYECTYNGGNYLHSDSYGTMPIISQKDQTASCQGWNYIPPVEDPTVPPIPDLPTDPEDPFPPQVPSHENQCASSWCQLL